MLSLRVAAAGGSTGLCTTAQSRCGRSGFISRTPPMVCRGIELRLRPTLHVSRQVVEITMNGQIKECERLNKVKVKTCNFSRLLSIGLCAEKRGFHSAFTVTNTMMRYICTTESQKCQLLLSRRCRQAEYPGLKVGLRRHKSSPPGALPPSPPSPPQKGQCGSLSPAVTPSASRMLPQQALLRVSNRVSEDVKQKKSLVRGSRHLPPCLDLLHLAAAGSRMTVK